VKPPLKIVIACGGTGGHLFPGIAIGEELQSRGHDVLLLVSEKAIDSVALEDHPELRFEKLPAVGLPKLFSPRVFAFGVRFLRTLRETRRIVRQFGADAVLGMGGFTSLPPVLAGRRFGAATFIHESNAIPGKANRLTARFCSLVLLGMEACARWFHGSQCRVVGTPLRRKLMVPAARAEAASFFGLDPGKLTVLVMGGSQGAHGVNAALVSGIDHLDPQRAQLIALTGPADEPMVREAAARRGITAFVAPFSGRLDLAYAATDLCVARAGGSSLAELAHFGLPAILIPYPFAADDHQLRNAEIFANAGAAVLLRQGDLAPGELGLRVAGLLDDPARRSAMRQSMQRLSGGDSAARIANVVEETISERAARARR
jgi:UDP-N-acetylglucosamine--N-acetylmuramyl-(pentapeptide) pyrophosphoryl-undecaprenol N-acetylglucosamine transferase